jgi:hypothetical protein
VHDRIPAKTATKCTAPARVEADMVNTEKTPPIVTHIDEVIGERGLVVEVHKRTIGGVMDFTIFPVADTGNIAQRCTGFQCLYKL